MPSPLRRQPTPFSRDFVFHDGKRLPELKVAYRTLGQPHRDAGGEIDNAVMILHGTGGNGGNFLTPDLGKALFGPGAPFDKDRYYVILPDAIGHGGSSRPSDGLRMGFPAYDYADMVEAQKRMLTEQLGVKKLKAILGMSMGGMVTFQWATTYPDFAETFIPMGCYPVEIAGQNRMQRKLQLDAIKGDPGWNGGNYAAQPLGGLRTATGIAILMGASPLNLHTTSRPATLRTRRSIRPYRTVSRARMPTTSSTRSTPREPTIPGTSSRASRRACSGSISPTIRSIPRASTSRRKP